MTNNQTDIEQQDRELHQLIAEAMIRKEQTAPDTDSEWERLAARMSMSEHVEKSERVEASEPVEASEHTVEPAEAIQSGQRPRQAKLRLIWGSLSTAATVAVVCAYIYIYGIGRQSSDELYAAKTVTEQVVIVNNEQETQHVVSGKELRLSQTATPEEHTLVVPEGKDMKLTLADGTRVWLNANSRLTYPTAFTGEERRVELQGEAYFEVAHDKVHPFIVKAGEMETRVLGTKFNINTYDAAQPHVTLVEGSVKVSAAQQQRIITPGQDATLDRQGMISVQQVDVNDVTCWTEGIEFFDNTPLRDIVMQMGSWYNLSVVCHDERALDLQLHYMYDRNRSVEEAVKMLNSISKQRVTLQNNCILIE